MSHLVQSHRIHPSCRSCRHRYHVSFDPYGWGSGLILTRAWAVALSLKYDDKALFDMIQRDKAVVDLEGVRELFFELGIDKVEFD